MRRATTRSPRVRNFIGILFPKILELLDYLQVAALGPGECQGRDRYLGRWAGTGMPGRGKQEGSGRRRAGGTERAIIEGTVIRTMETKMKTFAKYALGALALAGVATATTAAVTTPAEARIS